MESNVDKTSEVREAMGREKDLGVHKRLQILLCRLKGMKLDETKELTGASISTIVRVCKLYAKEGLSGLDFRYKGGNSRKLTEAEEARVLGEVASKAADGQYLRVADLQVAFEDIAGVRYNFASFWHLLKRHGWRKVSPRGRHPKAASEETCEAAKKLTLRSENLL
jgi:transposase